MVKGIQFRAHRADLNKEEFVGRFVQWPEDKVQAINCFGQPHNMITHVNNNPRADISMVWQAPDENIGAVVFILTLVESYSVFWSKLTSPRLEPLDPATVVLPAKLEAVASTNFSDIDWSECGKTKGCLMYPRQCLGSDCYAGVTYSKGAEGYTFEMFAEGEGYVSVGFSYDQKMGDDQTITCTAQGDRVSVQNGYNHKGLYNERMPGLGLRDLQTMQKDGKVFCRLTRPEAMQVVSMPSPEGPAEVLTFDLSVDFFLFLAWGYTYQDSDALRMHYEMPIVSDEKVNFRHFAVHRGSSVPFNPKVHGCLMIVGWMTMAGITMVMSRYFKEGLGAVFCLGSKTWFQLHRLCAILVFCLTAAGLALILVHLKGKVTANKLGFDHAAVGFTVVAAVCGQVVLGFLRPSPESRFRIVFVWLHRVLGKAAHILSAVALLLAFQWTWMPRVMRQFGLIVVICWICVQFVAEVLLELWYRCCGRKSQAADINMDDFEPSEKGEEPRPNPSPLPILLYLVVPLAAGCAGLCSLLLF